MIRLPLGNQSYKEGQRGGGGGGVFVPNVHLILAANVAPIDGK